MEGFISRSIAKEDKFEYPQPRRCSSSSKHSSLQKKKKGDKPSHRRRNKDSTGWAEDQCFDADWHESCHTESPSRAR